MDDSLPGRLKPCPSPGEVLKTIEEQCSNHERIMRFSSFSPSLYDVAWLSLVPKEGDLCSRLFPQCLEIILGAQQADGTWLSCASTADSILASLAAMLSIATQASLHDRFSREQQKLTDCLVRGTSGLRNLIYSWNVDDANRVGFELLVTSLLRQLDKFQIDINFPSREKLTQLYQNKIQKFTPTLVCGSKQTTFLHSAEAFVDIIQFQDIAHHCTEEFGIFGSPAATAAYLIHSPEWDLRAEKYLRKTVSAYGGTGNVPSAFPTPLFEISWAISSILSPVVDKSSLGQVELSKTVNTLVNTFKHQGSLVGFAPGILADADDTARNILMILRLVQHGHTFTVDVAPMIEKFETDKHFKTYALEVNPSFSANCNVVLALLNLGDTAIRQYTLQIEKGLVFLLDLGDNSDGHITDKWNISSEYSSMLLVEVLVLALRKYNAGCLEGMEPSVFTNRVPVAICRMVSKILAAQQHDGSWNHSLEVTSYSVLTLSQLLRLPWVSSIRQHLAACIERARSFITIEYPNTKDQDYLWIEKITFQSSLLRMAYCSMALNTIVLEEQWSSSIIETFTLDSDNQFAKMKKLFAMLPLTKKVPGHLLDLILLESKLHTNVLAANRDSILPRGELSISTDKYLAYIPIIWLLCNQINHEALSTGILRDMIKHSQFTFQIDEFMETTIAGMSSEETILLETWIQHECFACLALQQKMQNGHGGSQSGQTGTSSLHQGNSDGLDVLSSVKLQLQRFIHYVLHHDMVRRTPQLNQRLLAADVSEYLLAHMRQNSDNARLKKQSISGSLRDNQSRSQSSYFSWARSTGADHTSCPFSFRFFMCLIDKSSPARSFLNSPQVQYFASSTARHLATMCRQYNDYGSIMRDAKEGNLNSVDFAEFAVELEPEKMETRGGSLNGESRSNFSAVEGSNLSAKSDLMVIAEFERQLMELSFKNLAKVVSTPGIVEAIKVLVDVTDLFGQLYVIKDIASTKPT